ncbi:helix-turn-helix domain-containing protein [Nocardioides lianchengensis]|uniref:PucR C-terminal helix-turn-helix domain-containing protein n=1 Tax=Nocardioides lianchengensis TaxID=1045774 RepID=A0A1G6I4F9_9ACTN|nr:helix-turn-helix domain-containing protein [Nocardioides lianchengensis]NYG13196.1 hypothetical protein [Nocardioides lianchengensis]SDC00616.1 PucR C-terminal helix-turn-helix domain-containing protein [Nocardioides lianchengensis]
MLTHEATYGGRPLLPPDLVVELGRRAPALTELVADRVRTDVPDLAGPRTDRRHRRLAGAATVATHHFLELARGRARSPVPVYQLFRQVGYGEAVEGHGLGPVRAALRIAAHEAWSTVREFASEHTLTANDLGLLGDALFDLLIHVDEQVVHGHAMAEHALDRDVGRARARLLDALLGGADRPRLDAEAARAEWPVPASVVVLAATFHGTLRLDGVPDQVLARTTSSPAVLVCDAALADQVVGRLRSAAPDVRVVVAWPVPAEEVGAAHAWCTRVLGLVDQGVIAPAPVLWCRDHRTQVWLHADPVLRAPLRDELLQPLLDATPHARDILSETFLAWLETRASAPALAHRLGVHPQTVRYRWKRINELFGSALQDPEFLLLATMLLRSSVLRTSVPRPDPLSRPPPPG